MGENLSLIMRSARKYKGITQQELAKALNCSQSALSKMENGVLTPSAPQWFDFCRITEIPVESLVWGYIDRENTAEVISDKTTNGHNLPYRYSQDRGLKVKYIIPFLTYLCKHHGRDDAISFLKSHKISQEFFVDLDNQVSLNFLYDIFKFFQSKGWDNKDVLGQVTAYFAHANTHGRTFDTIIKSNDSFDAVSNYVQNFKSYQNDFKLSISGKDQTRMELTVKPRPHLKKFKVFKDTEFCLFLENYLLNSLEVVSILNKSDQAFKGELLESFTSNHEYSHYAFTLS